jgi:hypothetical protein
MNICYVVFKPDSLTFTIVKALSFCGHTVSLHVSDWNHTRKPVSNIQKRLLTIPHLSLTDHSLESMSAKFERGIIQAAPRLPVFYAESTPMAELPRSTTLITAGDRSHSRLEALQLQWKEIRTLKHWLSNVDRVAYKDGYYPIDFYRIFKPRSVVGFDVHSQFLHEEELFKAIHTNDWKTDASRSILVNFMGSQDPDIRRNVLDSVRSLFLKHDNKDAKNKSWFWHEYSDASPGGIGPDEFIDILHNSDFTLCPPGYSLITHRPFEALLNGSIPVLNSNELDLYDIGIADGINCIVVYDNQWSACLEKLATIEEEKIRIMRQNIKTMFAKLLNYEASAQRMCRRLGVV